MQNAFKTALKSGKPQIGFWLCLASPYTAEICATADFDWLLIDGEHSPNDVRNILAQLQAIAPYRSQPVVRPVIGEASVIKQILDIGAQTLLVPMIDTAQQAREMVRAVRYPPLGIRGVGSAVARASRWGMHGNYVLQANDEVCLLVQAETKAALDNLEEICGVDGVDGVFIGPADLSASLGYLGNPGHPEVQKVIDDALLRIIKSGKAAGILTSDIEAANRYVGMGCHFVAVGIDARMLAMSARALRAQFDNRTAPVGVSKGEVY